MFAFRILFTIVLAALAGIGSAQTGREASLRLWDSNTGVNVLINEYTSDLAKFNFTRRTTRIEFKGTWLLFANTGYNTKGDGGVQYVSSPDVISSIDLESTRNLFYSVKFVGSVTDIRTDAITFYNKYDFQGDEEKVTENSATLRFGCQSQSAILTGTGNEGWTLYDQPNFRGKAYCIVPSTTPQGYAAFMYAFKYSAGVPYGTCIGSVRKGCEIANKTVATRYEGGISFPSWDQ